MTLLRDMVQICNESHKSGAGYVRDGDQLFVDTSFVNKVQHKVHGAQLHHAGFGDFYLETPEGKVSFDRTSEHNIPDQSGRSHRVSGDQKAIDAMMKAME